MFKDSSWFFQIFTFHPRRFQHFWNVDMLSAHLVHEGCDGFCIISKLILKHFMVTARLLSGSSLFWCGGCHFSIALTAQNEKKRKIARDYVR